LVRFGVVITFIASFAVVAGVAGGFGGASFDFEGLSSDSRLFNAIDEQSRDLEALASWHNDRRERLLIRLTLGFVVGELRTELSAFGLEDIAGHVNEEVPVAVAALTTGAALLDPFVVLTRRRTTVTTSGNSSSTPLSSSAR
jgi:hypothetical protein